MPHWKPASRKQWLEFLRELSLRTDKDGARVAEGWEMCTQARSTVALVACVYSSGQRWWRHHHAGGEGPSPDPQTWDLWVLSPCVDEHIPVHILRHPGFLSSGPLPSGSSVIKPKRVKPVGALRKWDGIWSRGQERNRRLEHVTPFANAS
jgi:hypothetical protein